MFDCKSMTPLVFSYGCFTAEFAEIAEKKMRKEIVMRALLCVCLCGLRDLRG